MHRVNTKAAPASFFPENHKPVFGGFDLAVAKPTRDEVQIGILDLQRWAPIGKLLPVFEVSESRQAERRFADKQDPPVRGHSVNRANNDIDGQQNDQQLKPPGTIHVEKVEQVEQLK